MSSYTYIWRDSGITNKAGESVAVTCELDYQPAEEATYTEPGCPESITLEEAWVGDFDIAQALNEDQVAMIEGSALESLHDEATEAEISRAEARAEALWEDRHARDDSSFG